MKVFQTHALEFVLKYSPLGSGNLKMCSILPGMPVSLLSVYHGILNDQSGVQLMSLL